MYLFKEKQKTNIKNIKNNTKTIWIKKIKKGKYQGDPEDRMFLFYGSTGHNFILNSDDRSIIIIKKLFKSIREVNTIQMTKISMQFTKPTDII